jgi:hypothetical protein
MRHIKNIPAPRTAAPLLRFKKYIKIAWLKIILNINKTPLDMPNLIPNVRAFPTFLG